LDVTLRIMSDDLDARDIHELTLDISRVLERETDISTKLSYGAKEIGSKGEPLTVGTLVLTFLTSGAAVSFFTVLRSYFERNTSLEVELQRTDGSKLKIKADNMNPENLKSTMESVYKVFGGT